MNNKYFIRILLIGALVSLLLYGCSEGGEFAEYDMNDEDDKITISVFGNINATEKIRPLETLIKEYMDKNPNVNIVYEGIDPSANVDYNELLMKRLSTGNGDDVFMSYAGFLPTLAQSGYLLNLDDIDTLENYSLLEKNSLKFKNHYYGLPMEITVIGMYCNLDLLNEYNIEVPKNFDELLEACETLKNKGITPIAASQLIPFSGYAYADGLAAIYRSSSATGIINDISKGNIESGKYFLNGFTNLNNLLSKGYIDGDAAYANDTTANAEQLFADGKAAFLLGASDLNASIEHINSGLNYKVYPIPIEEGDGVVMTAPDHLMCINRAGSNIEIAKDFVKFCTKKENILKYVETQGSLSPLSGKLNKIEYLSPVIDIIEEGDNITSVDYNMNIRMQNWIQKAGIKLLEGDDEKSVCEYFDSLVREEIEGR